MKIHLAVVDADVAKLIGAFFQLFVVNIPKSSIKTNNKYLHIHVQYWQ
jgi:hypothetical protein